MNGDPLLVAGLDLGQSQDYTALSIMQAWDRTGGGIVYDCGHLERFPLGTSYPAIVETVKARLMMLGGAALVVDATGVGAPVVDLLEQAGLQPYAVTITAGTNVHQDGRNYRTPKRDLVSALQVALQCGRLRVAEALPEAARLVKELLSFQVRIDPRTAHDSYAAWREGAHDDLVLAVALPVWFSEFAASLPVVTETVVYQPTPIGPRW